MAMLQNRVRPGADINVRSNSLSVTMDSIRGVVTMPWISGWGGEDIIEITPTTNILAVTGYDIGAPELLTIREALKRARTLLVYRVNGDSGAVAMASESLTDEDTQETTATFSATAIHRGSRGNDITVRVVADIDDDGYFVVETLIDTAIMDVQRVSNPEDLVANNFVSFNADTLFPIAGLILAGGEDEEPTVQGYANYFDALLSYDFNVMAMPIEDEGVKNVAINFIKMLREDESIKCTLAVSGIHADHEAIINVRNGVILSNGTVVEPHLATAWVAGATAGANINESNTYSPYQGAIDVTERLTNTEIIRALQFGEFLFEKNNGRVVVEQDINSHTTFTVERNRSFSKNRVMRVLDDIANATRRTFSLHFIGQVTNNEQGRNVFKSSIIEYLNFLESISAIENFDSDDVTVERGNDVDAVVVHLYVQPTDAMEKLYMLVEVQ